ncbi:MAG: DUF5067 domain-containing protein [Hominilimicola sp.]
MKKRLIIVTAALILAMSAAGCGQKTSNTGATQNNTQQTDASGAYENNGAQQNGEDVVYSELVDMDKVEGETAASDSDKNEYKGELGDVEVTIEDAKLISYEDEDVAVVSFKYKNNSGQEASFTSKLNVEAYQNDDKLPPAVIDGVDGVSLLSMSENVKKGDTITVQKAFKLRDKSQPLTVEVREFVIDENSSDGLVKTFNF